MELCISDASTVNTDWLRLSLPLKDLYQTFNIVEKAPMSKIEGETYSSGYSRSFEADPSPRVILLHTISLGP